MEGIDVTDIVRLREFAKHCDWYVARMTQEQRIQQAVWAKTCAMFARADANQLEAEDGLPHGTIDAR